MKRFFRPQGPGGCPGERESALPALACPEDIDASVWAELPPSIQAELVLAAGGSDKGNDFAPPVVGQVIASTVSDKKLLVPSIFKRQKLEADEVIAFSDDEFPAAAESIDGRVSVGDSTSVLKCHCGRAARIRQVSKAGVNQGRHFYSCSKTAPERGCNFFAWAQNAPHSEKVQKIQWKRFTCEDGWCFVVKARGFRAEDVLQGGVGNCWFLSAVAVVAERADLIDKVVVSRAFQDDGSSRFRFFLDGDWRTVRVDNYLPYHLRQKGPASSKGLPQLYFSKAKLSQLWVPFLEKSYAKLHGSYEAISGGFISEALMDLTCAPCETMCFFSDGFDSEEAWERLLSFSNAGFPMGCSTDTTGEGIVGNHAYSILDVRQISEAKLGSQSKINSFFEEGTEAALSAKEPLAWSDLASILPPDVLQEEIMRLRRLLPSASCSSGEADRLGGAPSSVRLIRIRNPWGQQEWTGEMSKSSELWTTKLLSELQTGSKNDGTFWIFYHDFLRRFSSVDVCKCFRDSAGWARTIRHTATLPGSFAAAAQFELEVTQYTWLYLFATQKTKRGRTRSDMDKDFWYSDISLIVTKAVGEMDMVGAIFCGQRRDCVPLELHLERGVYRVHVVHFSPHRRKALQSAALGLDDTPGDEFSVVCYASRTDATMTEVPRKGSGVPADDLAALQFRRCLLQSVHCQHGMGGVRESNAANLTYARRNSMYTCRERPICIGGRPVITLDGDPTEAPTLHVLHGSSDITFLVVMSLCTTELTVLFTAAVTSSCRLISPYVSHTEAIPADDASATGRLHHFCVRSPPLSLTCTAVIFENAYTVEAGRFIDVKIANCVFDTDAVKERKLAMVGNEISSPFLPRSMFASVDEVAELDGRKNVKK